MVLANSVANKKFSGRISLIWNIRCKCSGLTIKFVYVERIQNLFFELTNGNDYFLGCNIVLIA